MNILSNQKNKGRWKIGGVAGLILLLLAIADYAFYPLLPVGGQSFNRGQNANWLRDSWWRGTEKETVASLAARLKREQISTAYFHVRFIKKDGTLRFRGPEYAARARKFNAGLKTHAPNIKSLAWIYVGNERGLTGVDLSAPATRRAMIREVRWLVEKCGFEGVQWDYEICDDGDRHLLSLLQETRAAIGKHRIMSISTPMWLPRGLESWGWSEEYFARVAKNCNEVVVMAYDSGLYFPRHYVWLMQQQAVRVPRAVRKGNANCRVLLGVPTYEDGGISHHIHAENLKMGIKGARRGLSVRETNFTGLAVFADYTTDEAKWKIWRELWLEQN